MACKVCVQEKLDKICAELISPIVKSWLHKRVIKIINEKCPECERELH